MGIIAFIIAVLCLFKWKQAKYDKENFDANSSKYKSLNKRSKILLIISILAFIFSIGSCISSGSKTSDTKKYVQTEENMSDDERNFKEKQDKEQEEARKAVEKARAEQPVAKQDDVKKKPVDANWALLMKEAAEDKTGLYVTDTKILDTNVYERLNGNVDVKSEYQFDSEKQYYKVWATFDGQTKELLRLKIGPDVIYEKK